MTTSPTAPPLKRARRNYGTRTGAPQSPQVGLVDPAWTRLLVASLAPIALAVTTPLPAWTRLVLVVVLTPLVAQGWPALVRSEHNQPATNVIACTGLAAALAVGITHDFGAGGIVMALSVLLAFVAQMWRRDGRANLVEDLSATVTGNLVVVCGAGWCATDAPLAAPALITPCALALFVGALLTTLNTSALVLETLTITISALVAGAAGGALALTGFFGPFHMTSGALSSAGASLLCGFLAGAVMAAANRVLWTHRWVPGGRAAVASALVPIMVSGAPVYAIGRLMGSFVAG